MLPPLRALSQTGGGAAAAAALPRRHGMPAGRQAAAPGLLRHRRLPAVRGGRARCAGCGGCAGVRHFRRCSPKSSAVLRLVSRPCLRSLRHTIRPACAAGKRCRRLAHRNKSPCVLSTPGHVQMRNSAKRMPPFLMQSVSFVRRWSHGHAILMSRHSFLSAPSCCFLHLPLEPLLLVLPPRPP